MKVERPKPCPCCGNKKLHIGHQAAMLLGVKCEPYQGGCGLRMVRTIPDTWPKSIKSGSSREMMNSLDLYTLKQAIEAWNKRVS